jgi:hypothetical protein
MITISKGFILTENAKERVLIPISSIIEVRDKGNNKVHIKTENHETVLEVNIDFNTLLIKLDFYD